MINFTRITNICSQIASIHLKYIDQKHFTTPIINFSIEMVQFFFPLKWLLWLPYVILSSALSLVVWNIKYLDQSTICIITTWNKYNVFFLHPLNHNTRGGKNQPNLTIVFNFLYEDIFCLCPTMEFPAEFPFYFSITHHYYKHVWQFYYQFESALGLLHLFAKN